MFSSENVKSVAHSNPTASAVFLELSQRERGRHIINLDLLETKLIAQGVKIDSGEFLTTFKQLEETGAGRLVYGRRGNPNCFIWNYDLKDVARIGLGSQNVQPRVVAIKPSRSTGKRKPPTSSVSISAIAGVQKAVQSKKDTELVLPPVSGKKTSPRGAKRRYIHISIPIDMIKGLKY